MKITQKDLQNVLARINRIAGFNSPKWSEVGSYTLDGSYGGWQLQKFVNKNGAVQSITHGFNTKKETYNLMQAFISGMEHNND